MSIFKVSREKVAPSPIVAVNMELGGVPVLPKICPCCCELADQGAFIVARCEGLPSMSFPACAECARHTTVNGRIAGVMGLFFGHLNKNSVAGHCRRNWAMGNGDLAFISKLAAGVHCSSGFEAAATLTLDLDCR